MPTGFPKYQNLVSCSFCAPVLDRLRFTDITALSCNVRRLVYFCRVSVYFIEEIPLSLRQVFIPNIKTLSIRRICIVESRMKLRN